VPPAKHPWKHKQPLKKDNPEITSNDPGLLVCLPKILGGGIGSGSGAFARSVPAVGTGGLLCVLRYACSEKSILRRKLDLK
jgi:hypothetical protein